jgi:hypothetical protein
MRSSRTLYALAFSIAAIGAALSPPASALPKSGSSGGHSAPTSEPTPWYQTSQSDVHCGSNDPVVAVFLGNPKFYAPPGSQESYSSSGFTCKSVAIDHGLLPPPSVAPGWHMSSMTGSVAWNAPTSGGGAGYISNSVGTSYVINLVTIDWTRPNATGALTTLSSLPSSHTIAAQLLDAWGNSSSSQTYYCVRLTQYDAAGNAYPESQVHYIKNSVEYWRFTASVQPPPSGVSC